MSNQSEVSNNRNGTGRSPAVKRLMREAIELSTPTEDLVARPLEDNLFEWHFTVRGPRATDFNGGIYHGRILLPEEYPMRPPHIILLTPNGRFEINKKICLSISGHHPETWQPSWSIRTALLALIAFMPTPSEGTLGSIEYTPAERRNLARRSLSWQCPNCGNPADLLIPINSSNAESTSILSTVPQITNELPRSQPTTHTIITSSNDSLDNLKDCIIICLVISIAIFVYRRFHIFTDLNHSIQES